VDETLANVIVMLKTEFVKRHKGRSHIHEIIPVSSKLLRIDERELKMLH